MSTGAFSAWPGRHYPLGATWDGAGVNFAIFSETAERVFLCLFDETGEHELTQLVLPARTDNVWHGYLPGLAPGALYGYRVLGPFSPERGLRFNPNKLLIDPYARGLFGKFVWDDAHFGYLIGDPAADLSFDERDNAQRTYKCSVVSAPFDWEGDCPPRIPWRDTIIYELHVKGFTKTHPRVPEELRGTYLGLGSPAAIGHLKSLGVTTVELLPVQAFLDDRVLFEKGLANYWGYNTISYFAPEARYSLTDPVAEFKTMVRALHGAGIEVVVDVVYNHTAEGNELGPTLSLRGIDNHAYYRLARDNPRYYRDFTGCGNTLNMMHPRALQLVMDSLRYWVLEMHVDGFRFDLAAALAREEHAVDPLGAFFDIIRQDPVLSQVKMIAEPWDLGHDGYQLGNFPGGWSEWNAQYRDTLRSFWRGDAGVVDQMSRRMTGSGDLYQHRGRGPSASINFITCHDGFPLEDIVSYDHKHNDNNLDGNSDGCNNNVSWNCGIEGPSGNPAVTELRDRQKRNMIASLLLSHGVPMLTAGDELGRSQRGNNNAYCQDNELSWINWTLLEKNRNFVDFVRKMISIRKEHLVFRRTLFANCLFPHKGNPIFWFRPDGAMMHSSDWHDADMRTVGLMLPGNHLQEFGEQGARLSDDSFIVLLNAHWEGAEFRLPFIGPNGAWSVVFDTADDNPNLPSKVIRGNQSYALKPRSLALLLKPEVRAEQRRSDQQFRWSIVPPPGAAAEVGDRIAPIRLSSRFS